MFKSFQKYRKWFGIFISTYDHFVEQVDKEFPKENTNVEILSK